MSRVGNAPIGAPAYWRGSTASFFLGVYIHSLDPKGRLTIPARFRTQLADGLVISRGPDPCLVIYPQREWESLATNLSRLPRSQRAARSYNRLLFGGAAEANMDRMGRVLVPSFLREYAAITEDAVVVGVNTVIEVWNPDAWRLIREADSESMDDILGAVGQMGV